jgi:poly(A) polymerase
MNNECSFPHARREQAALRIVERLRNKGFQALYAGGYVRDMLLGMENPGDIDIATDATPAAIARLFRQVLSVGEQFGVMIVVEKGIPFEVATFRSDVGATDGRHPDRVEFADPRSDALRRDFTINGMFYDPLTREVHDYVGGQQDLRTGTIRAIGDPEVRFSEDYLRLLRGVRFAARLGFSFEPATWDALREQVGNIGHISAERIFAELDKMLLHDSRREAMELLHECGLLGRVLPDVEALHGIPQPPEFHPEGDVYTHTLMALSLLQTPSRCLTWSTLLHDIGKRKTMSETDRIRFHNHHRVGSRMAQGILRELRAPRQLIECVSDCVENHMNFMNVQKMRTSTLKRFLSRPTIHDELELHRVDCLASHGDISNYEFLTEKLRTLGVEQLKPEPWVSGKDLIALGYKPGPIFGRILRAVYDEQLEERICSREEALAWIRSNYRKH